uniref:Alpha-2-macroglobulin n=1 Tax=Tetraodon nigroviridis TaxID=99883 RepID=H3DA36_TETNG
MWTWSLCVLLSWTLFDHVAADPQYMLAVPAILEAGEESKFCISFLEPNETMTVTVSLKSKDFNTTLMQMVSKQDFHECRSFEAPSVEKDHVMELEVEVQADTFYSKGARKVLIRQFNPESFIQTDKPLYLPGQTVQFRVVSLDSKLRPSALKYSVIELKDPSGNRIGQWLNQTTENAILQLSHQLNSEAPEGSYEIRTEADGKQALHWFKVEKYVLPKFEVTITSKPEVNIAQEEFEAEVCAKYTYGQPVAGSATMNVCRGLQRYYFYNPLSVANSPQAELEEPCHKQTKKTDQKGCATFTFMMSTFTQLDVKALDDQLTMTAHVEEEGTDVKLGNQMTRVISYRLGGLSFINTPTVFKAGSTVEGTIKAVHHNGTPVANTAVYLFEGEIWSARRLQNLTTDGDGLATFSVSTAARTGDLKLQASVTPELQYIPYRVPYYENGQHQVSLFQKLSPSGPVISSLEVKAKAGQLPCKQQETFTITYTVVGEEAGAVDLMYLVLSRGNILRQGSEQFTIEKKLAVNVGEFTFTMMVTTDMAPSFQVVAYAVLPSQSVIADYADFSTEKCFGHSVSLEFSEGSAVPGEEITMQLDAQPKALCGMSAVDRSIFVKEPEARLSADTIFRLMPSRRHVPYETEDPQECVPVRLRRSILPFPDGKDPFTVFQHNGLKMVTNLVIRTPTCLSFKGKHYYSGVGRQYASAPMAGIGFTPQLAYDSAPEIVSVRTFFPETWLFDLLETGESGQVVKSLKVPDTITTWEADAFCLSSEGFGMAPRVDLTVFQPFFLELTLPYSIIRGEQFELKATVFSYLSKCIMLTVTGEESADYKLVPLSGDQYSSCLCGGERKTVSWNLVASTTGVVEVSVTAAAVASEVSCNNEIVTVPMRGRVDKVTRTLIVKAEGTEVMEAFNWLFCPKGEELKEESTITLPTNVIMGSARGSVSVLGDIMGRALKNLDGLLRMPYGCGEQNMALLAPNIYILQYLEKTEQLTPPVKEKALRFLRSGYERQLNYRHYSGAYSTFGAGVGNIWLTTFVMRSFAKAAEFIYIDQDKMAVTKQWVEGKQQDNGCFEMVGTLFNNRMKGGVSDEITLTAYITASLLEMNSTVDETVKKSLSCLKTSIEKDGFPNVYTTALMAYAFTLAGDTETRTRLLNQLNMEAKTKVGGFLYWEQTGENSASLSVEISSYMVLTALSADPSTEDLGYASRIVRWLTTQQNYFGGFYSTQDTVVALQALALYSTLVFSPDGSTRVTVASPSASNSFLVTQDTKLLYQEKELADVEGKHVLEASGTGCAAVQLSVFYNIPAPPEVKTLTLEVSESANCASMAARATMNLEIKTGYTGQDNSSNMVILDIKFLSGFAMSRDALERLRGPNNYRVEDKTDRALVYIPEIEKDEVITHEVVLIQEHPIIGQKPAVVKLYDYYEPSTKAEKEYTYPCVSGNNRLKSEHAHGTVK